jgi:hypothetical protein
MSNLILAYALLAFALPTSVFAQVHPKLPTEKPKYNSTTVEDDTPWWQIWDGSFYDTDSESYTQDNASIGLKSSESSAVAIMRGNALCEKEFDCVQTLFQYAMKQTNYEDLTLISYQQDRSKGLWIGIYLTSHSSKFYPVWLKTKLEINSRSPSK